MDAFFLDTSAVIKYYHRERGSDFVDSLFVDQSNVPIISRLALVEIESAFANKVRAFEIESSALFELRLRVAADLAQCRVRLVDLTINHFTVAKELVATYGVSHGLRTLDALQLSAAIELRNTGLAVSFVTSDSRLCAVAPQEEFLTLNPELIS